MGSDGDDIFSPELNRNRLSQRRDRNDQANLSLRANHHTAVTAEGTLANLHRVADGDFRPWDQYGPRRLEAVKLRKLVVKKGLVVNFQKVNDNIRPQCLGPRVAIASEKNVTGEERKPGGEEPAIPLSLLLPLREIKRDAALAETPRETLFLTAPDVRDVPGMFVHWQIEQPFRKSVRLSSKNGHQECLQPSGESFARLPDLIELSSVSPNEIAHVSLFKT